MGFLLNSLLLKSEEIKLVDDPAPQLGGNLDINGYNIVGTGNIDINGDITANTLIGALNGEVCFQAKAGEAITKGQPVYISNFDVAGNKPVVGIADADDVNKMPAFGLAKETVGANANVNITTFGTLSNIDTSSFNLGDILYVSTSGTLTATKPTGESAQIQNVGKVQRVHATNGSIKVGGAGRTNDTPNLNDGNVFIGNASNQTESRALTLDDIAETIAKKIMTDAERTKLNNISVTQSVDLDQIESDVAINNTKITNATHTGDVTGSQALTISNDVVDNNKLTDMAQGTVKARTNVGTGDPQDVDISTTFKSALGLNSADVGLSNVQNVNQTNANNILSGTLSIDRLSNFVKPVFKSTFSGSFDKTIVDDNYVTIQYQVSTRQFRYYPKSTGGWNWHDAGLLYTHGSDNTPKGDTGDVSYISNAWYYFSNDGQPDSQYAMNNYGTMVFLHLVKEAYSSDSFPSYIIRAGCGNTNNMWAIVERT